MGTEAALWFCPFVETRGPSGITLLPQFSELLREKLRGDNSLLEKGRKVVEKCHENTPPVMRWEEELVYLSLNDGITETERKQHLEQKVWPVVKAISAGNRQGLEEWIVEMWDRLPEAAIKNLHLMQLRDISQKRIQWRISHASAETDPAQLARLDFSDVPTAVLEVLRTGDDIRIGYPSGSGKFGISVPDIEPITLEILYSKGDREGTDSFTVPHGEFISISVQTSPIRIRTIDGKIYLIDLDLFEGEETGDKEEKTRDGIGSCPRFTEQAL